MRPPSRLGGCLPVPERFAAKDDCRVLRNNITCDDQDAASRVWASLVAVGGPNSQHTRVPGSSLPASRLRRNWRWVLPDPLVIARTPLAPSAPAPWLSRSTRRTGSRRGAGGDRRGAAPPSLPCPVSPRSAQIKNWLQRPGWPWASFRHSHTASARSQASRTMASVSIGRPLPRHEPPRRLCPVRLGGFEAESVHSGCVQGHQSGGCGNHTGRHVASLPCGAVGGGAPSACALPAVLTPRGSSLRAPSGTPRPSAPLPAAPPRRSHPAPWGASGDRPPAASTAPRDGCLSWIPITTTATDCRRAAPAIPARSARHASRGSAPGRRCRPGRR